MEYVPGPTGYENVKDLQETHIDTSESADYYYYNKAIYFADPIGDSNITIVWDKGDGNVIEYVEDEYNQYCMDSSKEITLHINNIAGYSADNISVYYNGEELNKKDFWDFGNYDYEVQDIQGQDSKILFKDYVIEDINLLVVKHSGSDLTMDTMRDYKKGKRYNIKIPSYQSGFTFR